MTKAQLINAVIEKTGLLKKECGQLVESIFELMSANLESGKKAKHIAVLMPLISREL